MARRISRDPIYRGCRFSAETIETCVYWYITYRLSYRDLAAMMAERGIVVSHTIILRWVLRYVPEYERRRSRFGRLPGSSWRMDETAVAVRGGRHYLYRAVDRRGKSVASLLCNDRSMEAAQAFFRAAVSSDGVPWPEKINVDGNSATHRGLRLLGDEDHRWRGVEVRARRYLKNVVEQDHRAIKQRCAPETNESTRASTGRSVTPARFFSGAVCICSSTPRVGGTGTTSTGTAASGRRSRSGPIRMFPLPWRRRAIALRGGCSPRVSIRRCGGANCGGPRLATATWLASFPGGGFRRGERFTVFQKCSPTVTEIQAR